jgi:ParB family chromosome partitioning protein
MKLDFIPLGKLCVSKANMRHGRKAPDVADILPTVRRRGVIQSLLVRPSAASGASEDIFEIVAGRRRYHAACLVAEERRAGGAASEALADVTLLPCAILDEGDDAGAIEASLIENAARLDPDEVTRWETFSRLVREGRTPDEIAATFGLPDLAVRRVLALGNLLPRIRTLYAKEQIDAASIRHLTLASKRQQQDWLALVDDPEARAPTGRDLKAWLLGGQTIPASLALFDVAASGLATVADLFGEDCYFAAACAFWEAQNAAIEARRTAYLADGWGEVVTLPEGAYFHSWEYDKTPKRKGGRVYVEVRASGEVTFHEGYVSRREAERAARGDAASGDKLARPEITSGMQTYLDLHRHAAVRAALTAQPQVALRLMLAHAIHRSPYWAVRPDPQASRDDATTESVENSLGEARFDERRRAVLALLGFGADEATVTGGNGDEHDLVRTFLRLLDLPDASVMEVVAVVMGETLASGSAAVEATGQHLAIDMAAWWQADAAFFGLVRDRQVLRALVAEVAGEAVASANDREKGATLKRIVADHLAGEGGREKVTGWVPRWIAFPPAAYTERGGVGTVRASATVAAAKVEDEPDPTVPPAAAVPGEDGRGAEGTGSSPDEVMPLAA